jgi:hypothetical protein
VVDTSCSRLCQDDAWYGQYAEVEMVVHVPARVVQRIFNADGKEIHAWARFHEHCRDLRCCSSIAGSKRRSFSNI